jgi:hypothetical protein
VAICTGKWRDSGTVAEIVERAEMELMSAIRISKRERVLASIQREYQKDLARIWRREGNLFLQYFSAYRYRFKEASGDEVDRIFDVIFTQTDAEKFVATNQAHKLSLTAGFVGMGELFGEEVFSYSMANTKAVDWYMKHGARLVTQINETTRLQIKRIMLDGIERGQSYGHLARRIKNRFNEFAVKKPQLHIRNRAELVSVTETRMAYEAGAYEGADQIAKVGIPMEKQWLTVGDDRVSEGCESNEFEGWIDHDVTFSSGHLHAPRFPGCRCDIMYQAKKL